MILGSGDQWKHRAEVRERAGSDGTLFRWHWPANTLRKGMSAHELATFLMPHMPSVLPLLSGHPAIQAEFAALLVRTANAPDERVGWLKSVVRQEEDDIVTLGLGMQTVETGPTYFVGECG